MHHNEVTGTHAIMLAIEAEEFGDGVCGFYAYVPGADVRAHEVYFQHWAEEVHK